MTVHMTELPDGRWSARIRIIDGLTVGAVDTNPDRAIARAQRDAAHVLSQLTIAATVTGRLA